jgi:uncharacterized BrkB/YihY/UPF0761 family membrane protein
VLDMSSDMKAKTEALKTAVDEWQMAKPPAGILAAVVKKFVADSGTQLAALLTYYGFFSLFPLLMVAFTVMGFVLDGRPKLRAEISQSIEEWLPFPGVDARGLSGSGFALVIGILLALWAGLGGTQVAQDAVCNVFDVPKSKRLKFIQKRLRGLKILAGVGLGLLIAAVGSSIAAQLGLVAHLSSILVTFIVNALLIGGVIRLGVPEPPTWSSIRWGAISGGIGWTALGEIAGWYTARLVNHADKTYGVFAVVIGLLSWIYLQGIVFIFCAEVAAVTSKGLWPRPLFPTAEDPETQLSDGIPERLAE